jgi:four helix bundle protein
MYRSFKEFPVWQEAMGAAEDIFRITERFPKKEDYGITSQIRRSAESISASIAEAFGRSHSREKVHYYYFARGSLTETLSHIEYCLRVKYLDIKEYQSLNIKLEQILFDLNKIIKTLSHRVS